MIIKIFKKSNFYLTMLFLLMSLVAGCSRAVSYNQKGWSVSANPRKENLIVKYKDLGVVVTELQLNLKKNHKISRLSGWSVEKDLNKLIITTREPDSTKWEFKITEGGLDISSSVNNGVITGIAPASEGRIPARVASQDNGVIYTSLGFVSAKNIYSLFDRKTDILIRFPKESNLSRDTLNERLMDLFIPLVKGQEISLIPEYYTEKVGLAHYQRADFKPVYKQIPKRFSTAPTGWCSWYCYYMAPTEEDMVKETDALAKELKPYGSEYVQLDACYTRGKDASYLEWNKESFPKGGKWLFQYIKDKGLKPGLWINVYGSNYANPESMDKYPEDFFLRDKDGNLSSACCTADTTVVRLDYTNPEVIEKHLKPMFRTLVKDWGLKYLKDAGWGTWMDYYEENKERAYDSSIGSREAYRNVQSAIRDIMGPDNYITGCAMHEVGIGFGFFDGSRTGGDDYASWRGKRHWSGGMQTFFKSLFGANYLNGIVWWSDPDNVMVRDPLTLDEGKTIVSSIALTGQTYMIGDFVADFSKKRLENFLSNKLSIGWAKQYPNLVKSLPEEKLDLYKKTMPTMPITPIDLYPFRTEPIVCPDPTDFPKALDLKVNAKSGNYDVVAVYNWSDKKSQEIISFGEDLGLDHEKNYLIFDFWNHELVGTLKDEIQATIPPHGVRVFVIRALSTNPQLLATSRHITGAYSIKDLRWNSSNSTLTGTSRTITGVPYTLFIYLPTRVRFSKVIANAKDLSHSITPNNVLKVSFKGQKAPVNWTVEFTGGN